MMPAFEAWKILGQDAGKIILSVSEVPLRSRAEALKTILEDARKTAKKLMAEYHPDRPNGNPAQFKKVGEALRALEFYTNEFEKGLEIRIRQLDEAAERRGVFIKVD